MQPKEEIRINPIRTGTVLYDVRPEDDGSSDGEQCYCYGCGEEIADDQDGRCEACRESDLEEMAQEWGERCPGCADECLCAKCLAWAFYDMHLRPPTLGQVTEGLMIMGRRLGSTK